jgi:hypothetical protein
MIRSKGNVIKYMEARQKYDRKTVPKPNKNKALFGIIEETFSEMDKLDKKGKAKQGRVYSTLLLPVSTMIDTTRSINRPVPYPAEDSFITNVLGSTTLPISYYAPLRAGQKRAGRKEQIGRVLTI